MATFHWNVTSSSTGQAVSGAYLNLLVSTNPCPKTLGITSPGCTSGKGYPIQVYTDASGNASATIQYTCQQDVTGTVAAASYAQRNFSDNTGFITGDIWYSVQLSPSTAGSTIGEVPGQGSGATTSSLYDATSLSTQFSNLGSGLFADADQLGWVLAVIIIGIAIALIAVAVLVRG